MSSVDGRWECGESLGDLRALELLEQVATEPRESHNVSTCLATGKHNRLTLELAPPRR